MAGNARFGIQNVPPIATLSAVAAVVLIGVIALFILLGQGGSGVATGSQTPGPAADGGCAGEPEDDGAVATITFTGDLTLTCTLEGPSGDVSPTDTLIAGVWTETVDDPNMQYGDIVTLVMGGPVYNGTRPTADDGLAMTISWGRMSAQPDASGNPVDIFDHIFESDAGECQVTMATGPDTISGTFDCPALADGDGHTVHATGTFRL